MRGQRWLMLIPVPLAAAMLLAGYGLGVWRHPRPEVTDGPATAPSSHAGHQGATVAAPARPDQGTPREAAASDHPVLVPTSPAPDARSGAGSGPVPADPATAQAMTPARARAEAAAQTAATAPTATATPPPQGDARFPGAQRQPVYGFDLIVRSDSGAPLAGARVQGQAMQQPLGAVFSDAVGIARFVLPRTLSGMATFTVEHPLLEWPARMGPFDLDAQRAEVRLPLRRHGWLRLDATDDQGRPIPAPVVHLLGARGPARAPAAGDYYAIPWPDSPAPGAPPAPRAIGLPVGEHQVRVSAAGYSSTPWRPLSIRLGETTPLEVALQATGQLSGRVIDRADRRAPPEPAPDEPHDPPLLIIIEYEGGAAQAPESTRREVVAQPDGAGGYRIDGIDAGRYRLRAARKDDLSSLSDWTSVTITPGARTEVPDLVLGSLPPVIEGQVTRDDGAPLEGVTVRCGPHKTITDAGGRYALYDLTRSQHRIEFLGPTGYGSASIEVQVKEPPTRLDQKLERTGTILGTVRWRDGRPGAQVALELFATTWASARPLQAVTDPQGRFYLANLSPGDLRLVLPGHPEVQVEPITLRPGENLQLPDIILPDPAGDDLPK